LLRSKSNGFEHNNMKFFRESGPAEISKRLGIWNCSPARPLPWRLGDNHRRCHEQVRPIFWASRPRAYVHRTQHWDDFPNGRWGKHDSPAFGDLSDYYLFYLKSEIAPEELRGMWLNNLQSEQDVWHVFQSYVDQTPNKQGVKVGTK
jgi:methylenetetrahydrofolate reductase (NADPH)